MPRRDRIARVVRHWLMMPHLLRRPTSSAGEPHSVPSAALLRACALVAVACAVYANSIRVPFVFDDLGLIRDNAALRSFRSVLSFFTKELYGSSLLTREEFPFLRPVQLAVYSLVWHIAGSSSAAPYHILNILLHCGVAVTLVFVLAPILGRTASFVAALVWAVHPIHTEAITYASGTADPLSLLFLLWAVHLASEGRRKAVAVFLFLLSVLSRESGVIFLPCLFLWDWSLGRLKKSRAGWYLFLALLTAGYLLWRQTVLGGRAPTEVVPFVPRFLTGFATLPVYLHLLFYPSRLAFERHILYLTSWKDPLFLGGLFIVFLLGGALVVLRQKRSLFFCVAWFLGHWLFHSGILFPLNGNLREHWMYAASVGVCGAGALALSSLGQSERGRKVAWAVVGAIVVAFGVRTYFRNEDWKDPIRFCRKDLEHSWDSPVIRHFLATLLEEKGRYGEAIAEYRTAALIYPRDPYTYFGLARCYIEVGEKQRAWQACEAAISLNPESPEVWATVAAIAMKAGDSERAERCLKEAERLKSPSGWSSLQAGVLALKKGDFSSAKEAFEKVVRLEPGNADGWRGLGFAQWNLNQPEEAVRSLETSLRLNPQQPVLAIALARCLQELNRHDEALRWFRYALRMNPKDRQARSDMAVSLAMTGKKDEAVRIWREIVKEDPSFEPARRNLEWAQGK